MHVRVLMRSGRLFEAGGHARDLLTHADASGSPIARVMPRAVSRVPARAPRPDAVRLG